MYNRGGLCSSWAVQKLRFHKVTEGENELWMICRTFRPAVGKGALRMSSTGKPTTILHGSSCLDYFNFRDGLFKFVSNSYINGGDLQFLEETIHSWLIFRGVRSIKFWIEITECSLSFISSWWSSNFCYGLTGCCLAKLMRKSSARFLALLVVIRVQLQKEAFCMAHWQDFKLCL